MKIFKDSMEKAKSYKLEAVVIIEKQHLKKEFGCRQKSIPKGDVRAI